MEKKVKNKKKSIHGIIIAIVMIILLIILFSIITKKHEIFENKQECTELEKIALENYIQDLNITMLQDTEMIKDKEELKIRYSINEYLKKSPKKIIQEEIFNEYKKIFEGNIEDILPKIEEILISDGISTFNPETEKYEKQEEYDKTLYSNLDTFKTLGKVIKISNNEYEILINIVQDVNIEILKNYYINSIEQNKNLGIDYEELYNTNLSERNGLKYLNKENYKEAAIEVKSQTIKVKVIDQKIIITDI